MDEIWLVPHRDGMLRIDAKISHVGAQESIILELLATSQMITPDAIADRIWPGKAPDNFLSLIQHRMVTVRKLLPHGYVKTVWGRYWRPRLIGWRLTGKINTHPAAGAAGD